MGAARDIGSRLSMEWGALAPTYDLQRPLEQRGVESLLGLLAPAPHERLLDLGTGTGAVLQTLASRPARPVDVLGIDSSAEMLRRVGPLPAGWRVTEADVSALPVAEGSIDVLSASYLLQVLDDSTRRSAVGEMARVLRPGGRAGALVPALPRGALRGPYASALGVLGRASAAAFGLAVIDAPGALQDAGLRVRRLAFTRRGYPSLCVIAERPA